MWRAIAATARSDLRIALRADGVGIAAQHSVRRFLSGIVRVDRKELPFSGALPSFFVDTGSSKTIPEPITRSRESWTRESLRGPLPT